MLSPTRCILISLALSFFFTGCTTKVTNTWIKKNYSGEKFASILVVGVFQDVNNKVLWENVMADNLHQSGIKNVITSVRAFPGVNQLNKQEIVGYVNKNNIEGVLVTRLVDIKKESAYYHPPSRGFYSGYYNSFPSYYDRAYNSAYTVEHSTGRTTVLLETTLYKSNTEELIWSMSSETFNPNSANQVSRDVGNRVITRLKKDKLI